MPPDSWIQPDVASKRIATMTWNGSDTTAISIANAKSRRQNPARRPIGWIGWSDNMADIPSSGCRIEDFATLRQSPHRGKRPLGTPDRHRFLLEEPGFQRAAFV